jgi:hypothetical protein
MFDEPSHSKKFSTDDMISYIIVLVKDDKSDKSRYAKIIKDEPV